MKKDSIIFVGSFVSSADSLLHPSFSQAANLYQQKFINFVNPELIISILPTFFSVKFKFKYHKDVTFVNNQSGLRNKLNYLHKLIFDTIEVLYRLKESKIRNVFFYNLNFQNIAIVFCAKYFLRKKVYIIIADYDNYRGGFIDNLYIIIFKKINGVIVLNSNIRCNHNSKVLIGLLYEEEIELSKPKMLNRNIFLSGSLGKTTGLEFALDYFSQNPQYNLYITGKRFRYDEQDFNNLMDHYQNQFCNIKYLGLLDYEHYLKVLNECDVALSFRNPNDEEHNYNFPSKIMEYLSKSKIVISTKKYIDLPNNVVFYAHNNFESLTNTLNTVYAINNNDMVSLKNNIYEYLKDNFTQDHTLKVLNELIND